MPRKAKCPGKSEEKAKVRQLKNEKHVDDRESTANAGYHNIWSRGESIFLLESLLTQLSNVPHIPCNRGIETINWSLVTIPNRSVDECKVQLKELIKDVKKYRTLKEVLKAHKQEQGMKESESAAALPPEDDDSSDGEPEVPKAQQKPTAAKFEIKKRSNKNTATASSSKNCRTRGVVQEEKKEVTADAARPLARSRNKLGTREESVAAPSGSGINNNKNKESARTAVKREQIEQPIEIESEITNSRGPRVPPVKIASVMEVETIDLTSIVRGPRIPFRNESAMEGGSRFNKIKKENRDRSVTSVDLSGTPKVIPKTSRNAAPFQFQQHGEYEEALASTHRMDDQETADNRAPAKRKLKRKQQDRGRPIAAKKKAVFDISFNVSDDQ